MYVVEELKALCEWKRGKEDRDDTLHIEKEPVRLTA